MIRIVFLKSTVRPCESVSRPSSRIWSRMLKTSAWAFSISSKRSTAYGLRRTGLGQLSCFLVADVAGRRADEPADRVPLLELAHVEADHHVLAAEQRLGERPGELRLADAGRAEEEEAAVGGAGIGEPGAGTPNRLRDRLDRLVLADDALVQPLLELQEPVALLLRQLRDRDAGAPRHDLGDVLDRHLGRPGARRPRALPAGPRRSSICDFSSSARS